MAALRPSSVLLRVSSVLLRASSVLLLSCLLLAGDSYVRREDVFSADPLSETPAPSRLSCAAWCDRTTGCGGFTFTADRSCQLFDKVLSGRNSPSDVQVQYVRSACPPGWYAFRDSCYLRPTSGGLNWEEASAACKRFGKGSDLASLNDEEEEFWIMHHPSRPQTAEFIGVKREDGTLSNVDGTSPSYQPSLSGDLQQSTSCLSVGTNDLPAPFVAESCSDVQPGYICESPLRCPLRSLCPAGWIILDDYCYFYVPTKKTVPEADQHCSALQPGGRISPVIKMGIFNILYLSSGSEVPMVVGITYQTSKGSFQSIDGTSWSVSWNPGEPNNGGKGEDCVAAHDKGASDIPCTVALPFICRAPRNRCWKEPSD